MREPAPTSRAALLEALILASTRMPPDALAAAIRSTIERAGGADVELVVCDLAQQQLLPLLPADHRNAYPVDGSPAGDAYRTRRSVRLPVPGGVRLWLPVVDSSDRIGALGVTARPGHPPERFLEAVAALAGELIVSKARVDDQLQASRRSRATTVAAEMRWAMLPPLTFETPAVTVSGIFEPAYRIAGDTFDYAVHGTTLHLAILDAMGHDLEASRIASVALASYRHSRRRSLSLADTATAMDEVVQECFDRSRYVTGQLATLDLATGRFEMLNLGHPRPLLARDGRVIGELEARPALPAGWGAPSASLFATTLEPGDMIIMYSDGITEAPDPSGDAFGLDRLTTALDQLLAQDHRPDEIARAVVEQVMHHQQLHARDDATLLVTKYRAP